MRMGCGLEALGPPWALLGRPGAIWAGPGTTECAEWDSRADGSAVLLGAKLPDWDFLGKLIHPKCVVKGLSRALLLVTNRQ